MKLLLVYWCIGCILMGASYGMHLVRCPLEAMPAPAFLAIQIATWPANLAAAIAIRDQPQRGCKASREAE